MKTRDSQIQPPCSCFTLGAPSGASPVCILGVAWGFLYCMTIMSSNIKHILHLISFGDPAFHYPQLYRGDKASCHLVLISFQ